MIFVPFLLNAIEKDYTLLNRFVRMASEAKSLFKSVGTP